MVFILLDVTLWRENGKEHRDTILGLLLSGII